MQNVKRSFREEDYQERKSAHSRKSSNSRKDNTPSKAGKKKQDQEDYLAHLSDTTLEEYNI